MWRSIHQLIRDTEAATAVEYCVMLALILMAVLVAVGAVGIQSSGLWTGIVSSIDSQMP